jgi:hypothetical protein
MNAVFSEYTYQDYLVYLLMHCGMADAEFSEEEQDYIHDLSSEGRIRRILKEYANTPAQEREEVIFRLKDEHCRTEEQQLQVLRLAKGLFEADHRFSIYEQEFYAKLQQLIRS